MVDLRQLLRLLFLLNLQVNANGGLVIAGRDVAYLIEMSSLLKI
jgi:hypothetical protein